MVRRPGLGYTTGSRLVALRLPLLGETKGETLQVAPPTGPVRSTTTGPTSVDFDRAQVPKVGAGKLSRFSMSASEPEETAKEPQSVEERLGESMIPLTQLGLTDPASAE